MRGASTDESTSKRNWPHGGIDHSLAFRQSQIERGVPETMRDKVSLHHLAHGLSMHNFSYPQISRNRLKMAGGSLFLDRLLPYEVLMHEVNTWNI